MKLTGEVTHILFFNEENNYIVFRLKAGEHSHTVSGTTPKLFIGEEVELHGEFQDHKKYGTQFLIESCQKVLPTSKKGMIRYLSSGLIKGIGVTLAEKLVEHFEEELFHIIDTDPDRLLEVDKIGEKKLQSILASFEENKNLQSILLFLHSYNIGHNLAMRIYNFYKEKTAEVIRSNPYDMIHSVRGIGFKMADEIALKVGIPPQSFLRLSAAIEYIFSEVINAQGHTLLFKEKIYKAMIKLVEITPAAFEDVLGEMVMQNKIKHLLDIDPNAYTLNLIFRIEQNIYNKLDAILNSPSNINYDFNSLQDTITSQFPTISIEQKEAIVSFLNKNFVIVTGGPGTGKTTLIKIFVMIAKIYNQNIALCAPTGRAAKRLSEATWSSAKTIHRMLEFNPATRSFKFNKDNPLKKDILIVDESSMIDIYLMNNLLNAVSDTTKLVFVGDADQLPSVGPGNLLHDLIRLFEPSVTFLKKIFRQVAHSKIILNAHKINQKVIPDFNTSPNDDFVFIDDATDVFAALKSYIKMFNIHELQILSPMQKGKYGVVELNKFLQDQINPYVGQARITHIDKEFRVGDKIIQCVNNYDLKVFNGDVGVITSIDEKKLFIQFDELSVEYPHEDLDQLNLAYAITIHKSQGSEYNYVIIFLMREQYILLNKNLIYTAITRAKQKAIVIGNKNIIAMAIKSKESIRESILSRITMTDESTL